jgi:hypothetical protein
VPLARNFRIPQSVGTWALIFFALALSSLAALFVLIPLLGILFPSPNNDFIAEGWGMAIGLVIAPSCLMISIALGLWRLWRKWTGAGTPAIGLNLNEESANHRDNKSS